MKLTIINQFIKGITTQHFHFNFLLNKYNNNQPKYQHYMLFMYTSIINASAKKKTFDQ